MYVILIEKDLSPDFAHLSPEDRRAILEILRETKKDLPEYCTTEHVRFALFAPVSVSSMQSASRLLLPDPDEMSSIPPAYQNLWSNSALVLRGWLQETNVRSIAKIALIGSLFMSVFAGCNRGAQLWPTQSSIWNQQQPGAQQVAQAQDYQRRASELDLNNRDLHSQLALLQQQNQLSRDEIATLRKQLSENATQLQSAQIANADAEKKIQTMQATVRQRGGAVITANNSLKQAISSVDIPGLDVRHDGDVLRIAIPAEQLFAPGTTNLLPGATPILDRIADIVLRQFPRQKIGVEGYVDNTENLGASAHSHQQGSAEALAVVDQLIRRNRIPASNLLMVSHGANHPLASNATQAGRTKNRRVEIVIYPETTERN